MRNQECARRKCFNQFGLRHRRIQPLHHLTPLNDRALTALVALIHIICDRITDHDNMLRSIGRVEFAVAQGCGDGAKNGSGPDPRDPTWPPRGRTLSYPPFNAVPDEKELLRIRSHDFH